MAAPVHNDAVFVYLDIVPVPYFCTLRPHFLAVPYLYAQVHKNALFINRDTVSFFLHADAVFLHTDDVFPHTDSAVHWPSKTLFICFTVFLQI
jgi:hypothetical protein